MILNKEKYLYLLPLKKLPFFKVGISSGDFSRINHLNRLYELDLDKALIVKSSNQRLIAVIEREILSVFEHKISDFKKMDGGTEIRKIEVWDSVIELLNYKKKYSDININNFIELNIINEKAPSVIKQNPVSSDEKTKRLEKVQKFYDAEFLLSSDDFMNAFDLVFEKVVHIEKHTDCNYYTFHFNKKLRYQDFLYQKLNVLIHFKSSKYDTIHSFGCRSMLINKAYEYILEISFIILTLNDVKSLAADCNFKHFQILEDIINTVNDRCSDFIKTQKNNR